MRSDRGSTISKYLEYILNTMRKKQNSKEIKEPALDQTDHD